MKTKVCTKCYKEKDLSEFSKDKNRKDGLHLWCKICLYSAKKNHYLNNKEKVLNKCTIYRKNNKEKHNNYQKQYYKSHKIEYKIYNKEYNIKNKKKLKPLKIEYMKEYRKNNIQVKIKDSLSSRIRQSLRGKTKSLNTMMLIGCEIDYLMYHIQSQFVKGMSWDNYGLWHIDHRKPCASFDFNKEQEQQKCFNFKNLQPLWAEDNYEKGDRYDLNS